MMFYEELSSIMERRGITAYRLSKMSGVPLSNIYSYKNGIRTPIDIADRLLNALGMKLEIQEIES